MSHDRQQEDGIAAQHDRLGYLDALRLLAAGIVATYHFVQTRPPSPAIRPIIESGAATGGVVLFFVISGFIMPYALNSRAGLAEFMLRRAFRIVPLYLVALGLAALAGVMGVLDYWAFVTSASAGTWLANILLIWDFVGVRPFLGVSWTLPLELIWYLIFFVAAARFGRRAAPLLNLGAAAALVALALVSLELERRIPLGRPAMIYASALGFQMYRYAKGDIGRRAMLGWTALFLGVTAFTNTIAFGHFAHVRVTLGPVLVAWIVAPLIFVGVMLSPRMRRAGWLNSGLIPAIGRTSYSLYLLHPIGIEIALQYTVPAWQAPAALAATAVLTYLGYTFVEVPSIRFGRRVAQALRRPGPGLARA